jgi:hypothetical protein
MTEKQDDSTRNGTRDPFQITTRDTLGLYLISENSMAPSSNFSVHTQDPGNFQDGENILPGTSRGEYNEMIKLAQFRDRFTLGLLGGLALIAPMLLMVLRKDLLTTLLTASVSTILFAAALAFFFPDLKGETVLGAVAGYAAVLVVFVGTTS